MGCVGKRPHLVRGFCDAALTPEPLSQREEGRFWDLCLRCSPSASGRTAGRRLSSAWHTPPPRRTGSGGPRVDRADVLHLVDLDQCPVAQPPAVVERATRRSSPSNSTNSFSSGTYLARKTGSPGVHCEHPRRPSWAAWKKGGSKPLRRARTDRGASAGRCNCPVVEIPVDVEVRIVHEARPPKSHRPSMSVRGAVGVSLTGAGS